MSAITPTTPATFYAFDESVISIPLVTLVVWISAVKLAIKLDEDISGAVEVIRDKLKTPDGYPIEHILEHLELCKENTYIHYGIK